MGKYQNAPSQATFLNSPWGNLMILALQESWVFQSRLWISAEVQTASPQQLTYESHATVYQGLKTTQAFLKTLLSNIRTTTTTATITTTTTTTTITKATKHDQVKLHFPPPIGSRSKQYCITEVKTATCCQWNGRFMDCQTSNLSDMAKILVYPKLDHL